MHHPCVIRALVRQVRDCFDAGNGEGRDRRSPHPEGNGRIQRDQIQGTRTGGREMRNSVWIYIGIDAAILFVVSLIAAVLRRHPRLFYIRFVRATVVAIAVATVPVMLALPFLVNLLQGIRQVQSQMQSAQASEVAGASQAAQSLQNVQDLLNSATPGPSTVRWHGRVVIPASGGLELDPVPPKPGSSADSDVVAGSYGQQDQISGSAAPWTGPAFPSQGQCSAQIASDVQFLITVRPGSVVCVQTAAGRIAALKFISVTGDHGSDVAEATVWQ